MEESLIEKIIKEYKELKKYKSLYESQKQDKKRMSEELYKYKAKEYKEKTYEQRVEEHINEICKDCRYYYGQNRECKWLEGTPKERLPENILEPIRSDIEYIPSRKICEDFQWD